MIKRTIYIGNPAYLRLKNQQLEIYKKNELIGRIPVEDMAILLLDNPQITITNALLSFLQQNNVLVITCDPSHLPLGFMLPCYGHSEYSHHLKVQIEAGKALKKQLWKQTVEAKIKNQAKLLELQQKDTAAMQYYLSKITSGDPANMEAKAAQYYWKNLFQDFRRNPQGETPNNLLNYGYAILRAIVARALVSSGLLVSLGIFHSNKYNPYCLADDIMEPYRPFIDQLILDLLEEYPEQQQLNTDVKAKILKIATQDVRINGKNRPLFIAISTTTASLNKCFHGNKRKIIYPEIPT